MSLQLTLLLLIAVAVHAQLSPIVTIPSGQAVQGLASSTGFQFLGIPFAQPPVGTLRFVDAQPVSPIPGVFNATQYGAACPQNCELPPHTCPPLIAEDCLSLNIYTPSLNPSRLLPVMFYIHGGNFKQGYGGGPLYDSSNLANATDTVFVTINYRLGALSSLVGSDPAGPLHGNYGITDQRQALKYVIQNIEAFGGDSSRITIFGQSAGAVSVAIHLLSPLSAGMFQRAIIQSLPFGVPLRSSHDAQLYTQAFAKFSGCNVDDMACLQALDTDTIITVQQKCQRDVLVDPNLLEIFMPTTPHWGPGSELVANPFDAFRTGQLTTDVPIVIGVTHDEAVPFIFAAFGKPLSKTEFELLLLAIFGLQNVKPLLQFYPAPANTTDYRQLMTLIGTHAIFVCPNRNATRSAMSTGSTFYSYVFDHVASFSVNMWGPNFTFCDNAVCHAAELPFVFQPPALSSFGDNMTPQELTLSNLMGAFWTNFAAAGVPDPSWPPYNALSQMHFTLNSSVEHDFLGATCDFWDNVIGYKWV